MALGIKVSHAAIISRLVENNEYLGRLSGDKIAY
jgi:hypothetical protein